MQTSVPVPNLTRGFVRSKADIKAWASAGKASSPSGQTMKSTKKKTIEVFVSPNVCISEYYKLRVFLPVMTCPKSSSGVSPKKGTHPSRNSYKMIPMAHQSTGLPYPWRKMTSGAMYSGVPHTCGENKIKKRWILKSSLVRSIIFFQTVVFV